MDALGQHRVSAHVERLIGAGLGLGPYVGDRSGAGAERRLALDLQAPALLGVEDVVRAVPAELDRGGDGRQGPLPVEQDAVLDIGLVVPAEVQRQAEGAVVVAPVALLDLAADAVAGLQIGVGVVAVERGRQLQGLLRPPPVGQVELHAGLAQDVGHLQRDGQGVGAAEPVVAGPLAVHAGVVGGRIGGPEIQGRARPVDQRDVHRPAPVGVGVGIEADGHRVVDPGVAQALLELGHLIRIIDVARLPRRQRGHPARLGAAGRRQVDPVHHHAVAGVDMEGRLQGARDVVDGHLIGIDLGVRVAALLHRRHHAPLGRQNIGRAARSADGQADRRLARQLGLGRRGSLVPAHFGIGDGEARTRGDVDHRGRLVALAHVGLDLRFVVAFGAQHRHHVGRGGLGPAAGLETALRRVLGGPEGALDLLAQACVVHALDARLGDVAPCCTSRCQKCGRRPCGRRQAECSQTLVLSRAPGFGI